VDASGKNMIIDRDGNPITPTAAWLDHDEETDTRTLARDPGVQVLGMPRWSDKEYLVDIKDTVFDGLVSKALPLSGFICHTDAASIHSAECVGHVFEWSIGEIAAFLHPVIDTREARHALHTCAMSAGGKRKEEDEALHIDSMESVKMAEIYVRLPLGPGRAGQELMVLIDTDSQQPIYYDFLQNVTPTKRRPFSVIRMEPEPEKWYGCGFYELFADRHRFIDLMLNRINFAASIAGNIIIEDPEATEEGAAGESLEFGSGKTYRLKKNAKINEVLKIIRVPSDGEHATNLMQVVLQVTQLEAGMTSAGDHGLASLPSAGLATGIKALERVANVLLKDMFYDFVIGIEETLAMCAVVTLRQIPARVVEKLVGPEEASRIHNLREVDLFKYKFKLRLSATKDSDTLQSNNQALQILMAHEELPPAQRRQWRPLFDRLLRTLGVTDVDDMLGPVPEEDDANMMQQQQGMGNALERMPEFAPHQKPRSEAMDRPLTIEPAYVDPMNPALQSADPEPDMQEPPPQIEME
jgi:hypothetical protein